MLRFDDYSRTLQRDEHLFELLNPETPEYYEEIFPEGSVPKTSFNHRHVPMRPAPQIWITDTTFRDGQQAMPPFSPKQIVDLYKLLHELSGANGLIRASEFFLYTQRDRKAVEECLALGYQYPEVTGLDPRAPEGLPARQADGPEGDGHPDQRQRLPRLPQVARLEPARRPSTATWPSSRRRWTRASRCRCHFEDITRADFYGFVVPFAIELRKLSEESGLPIKIRACDTMGYGVPYPGASLPRSVPGIIYGLNHYAGYPSELLEWHGHNDFHKALINSSTAWLYGCSARQRHLPGHRRADGQHAHRGAGHGGTWPCAATTRASTRRSSPRLPVTSRRRWATRYRPSSRS